jgi:hypothetical protein
MAWRNDVCQWRKSSENDEKFSRFSIANILLMGQDVELGGGQNLSL